MRLPARTGAVAVTAVLTLAIGGWYWSRGRSPATATYWNAVHRCTRTAARIEQAESLDDASAQLATIASQLQSLPTLGVDQDARDAALRFELALQAARRCIDQVAWMNEHWIRSTIEGRHRDALVLRLRDLRAKTLDAYAFAEQVHAGLTQRYPRESLARPYPPDLQPIDEALAALGASDADSESWWDVGYLLGALARTLIGH